MRKLREPGGRDAAGHDPVGVRAEIAGELAAAGFVAAAEEAEQLVAAARGARELLRSMVERRLTGEPLAWITGSVRFCGIAVRVDPGVYVPRPQTEQIALAAAALLPAAGIAVDLCTGCGAIAKTLMTRCPRARVLASDIDERAVACARANGVDAHVGDLFAPLPGDLERRVDVVVGVLPYVPTRELPLLHRDALAFEPAAAYDGGEDGMAVVRRALAASPAFLRPGGAVVLELGGDQAERLRPELERLGYADPEVLRDEDGDVRGIVTRIR